MSKLFIDNNGHNVPVAELELILAKEQLVVGNLERDLILRTAGNIKIQVGNKFYDLPLNTDSAGAITIGGVTIISTDAELGTIDYPGDGSLVYATESKSFYIAVNGEYVLINKVEDTTLPNQKIYLSFSEEQSLEGTQKFQVLLNAGYLVTTLDELGNFIDPSNTYEGQIVYSIADQEHFRLSDPTQPGLRESWSPLYITTRNGGVSKGGITITKNTPGIQDALLHLIGNNEDTRFNRNLPFTNTLLFSSNDYSVGYATWYNSTGNIYFESLSGAIAKGFNFIANNTAVLTLTAASSSIYGTPNYNYGLTINRPTLFNGMIYNNIGYESTDFIQGEIDGIGYSLKKDGSNLWVFEVDKLIVRHDEEGPIGTTVRYESKSINGSFWSPTELIITQVEETDSIQAYTIPKAMGSYTFNGTTYDLIPIENKLSYAEAIITIPGVDDEGDTEVTENIELLYGIGDRDSSGTVYSGPVTYVLNDDGAYITIPATHYYNGTEWVEDLALGTHVLSRIIYVYKITTTDDARAEIGDLLMYATWEPDESSNRYVLAHVKDIVDGEIIVWCYNGEIQQNDKVICIGNTLKNKGSFQINGIDENSDFIEVYDNIPSFRDMFENIHYIDVDIDGRILATNFVFSATSHVRVGNLAGKVNAQLGLDGSLQQGIYSDNAYIKGNFVGVKVIFGDQLEFENGVLTIADLEIIKNRTITGVGALTGGGTLYTDDIVLSHINSNWTAKTNLTGNNFISNLTIDEWGHVTNWVTRTITTDDIPEGVTNLYFNDTNVTDVTDPRYLKLNYPTLQTVTGPVKFDNPVKGAPATTSDEFVTLSQLTVSTSDYVINVPLVGVKDGSNQTFTLPERFIPNTVQLYVNGVRQGLGDDYIELTDTIIELTVAPISTAHMVADYRKA